MSQRKKMITGRMRLYEMKAGFTGTRKENNGGKKAMKTEKPIRIKINPDGKTQCGDLFIYKEGKGMCQNGVVHIEQKGFIERQSISFEISKIPKIIEALRNLPALTNDNEDCFMKEMEDYLEEEGEYTMSDKTKKGFWNRIKSFVAIDSDEKEDNPFVCPHFYGDTAIYHFTKDDCLYQCLICGKIFGVSESKEEAKR